MPTRFTKKHIDRCVESATIQEKGSLKLDREAGIVRGVKVLGWSGKGGQRIYQRRAVEQALPLYDGVVVNLNHVQASENDLSHPNRSVTERFGRIINPRVTDDGLFGDLKFNRKHYWAETFMGWVDDDPSAIGLSHDAILQGPMLKDGKRNIESIPKVFSVDIVADPGSTRGLHEDMTPDEPDPEGASVGMEDLDDESGDAEEHLCSFIVTIIKDKSLSMNERKAKVMEAMKLLDDEDSEGEEDEAPESDEKGEKEKPDEKDEKEDKGKPKMSEAKESLALTDAERAELDAFRAEKTRREQESKARNKCKVAELDEHLITETFVDILSRSQESKWDALIEDRKVQVGTREVTSSAPSPGGKKNMTVAEIEKLLLGKGN